MLQLPLDPPVAARILTQIVLRRLGGVGSGQRGHTTSRERAARAIANYKPSTRAKQQVALASEKEVAQILHGQHLEDNEPMDIVASRGKVGVEVKTLVDNKNDKITCHPESRLRKEQWVKTNHAIGHTVVVDKRGNPPPKYYYHAGFGAFRLAGMAQVTPSQLRKLVHA